jgi:hypothetical protein
MQDLSSMMSTLPYRPIHVCRWMRLMPDLSELTLDQRVSLNKAARR